MAGRARLRLGGSHIVVEKGSIFRERGVDSWRVLYSC